MTLTFLNHAFIYTVFKTNTCFMNLHVCMDHRSCSAIAMVEFISRHHSLHLFGLVLVLRQFLLECLMFLFHSVIIFYLLFFYFLSTVLIYLFVKHFKRLALLSSQHDSCQFCPWTFSILSTKWIIHLSINGFELFFFRFDSLEFHKHFNHLII